MTFAPSPQRATSARFKYAVPYVPTGFDGNSHPLVWTSERGRKSAIRASPAAGAAVSALRISGDTAATSYGRPGCSPMRASRCRRG